MRRAPTALALLALLACAACAPEGPSGFVTFNVKPDQNCVFTAEAGSNLFFPIGRYDISTGGVVGSENCNAPYVVHLLVNSFLRPNSDTMLGRAEPNILQLHSAEVKLMTIRRQPIAFDREDPVLPNPFLVTTNNSLFPAQGSTPSTGIAAVEIIPTNYAAQLDGFIGGQILAEIQIFGTTTGDVDVEFKPFVYPVEICDGCLTKCLSRDILARMMSVEEDVIKDECDDNSSSDGRYCIDPEC
jgi:hypothetical protein